METIGRGVEATASNAGFIEVQDLPPQRKLSAGGAQSTVLLLLFIYLFIITIIYIFFLGGVGSLI